MTIKTLPLRTLFIAVSFFVLPYRSYSSGSIERVSGGVGIPQAAVHISPVASAFAAEIAPLNEVRADVISGQLLNQDISIEKLSRNLSLGVSDDIAADESDIVPGKRKKQRNAIQFLNQSAGEISQSADAPVEQQAALNRVFGEAGPSAAAAGVPASSFNPDFALEAKRRFYPQHTSPDQPAAVLYRGAAKKGGKGEGLLPQGIPTDDEIKRREELSPLTNVEREQAGIEMLQAGGANKTEVITLGDDEATPLDKYDTVIRQDAGTSWWRDIFRAAAEKMGASDPLLKTIGGVQHSGHHNLYVVKKGRTDRIVVVGGHYDKVSEGRGSIDNWSGATMVANLYQAMKDVDTDATFVFILFAREEEGLVGSQAWLNSLTKEQKKKIHAMINLDTLAVDGTFSWKNNSTRTLLDLIMKVSREKGYKLDETTLHGGDSDSSTFRNAGIPAMTVYGASESVIFDIIHSDKDTTAYFSMDHYKNAYLLTLELLKDLAEKPLPKGKGSIWDRIRGRAMSMVRPISAAAAR